MQQRTTNDVQPDGPQERKNPFNGLAYYGVDDALWFAGRERELRIVIAHLRANRLTLLYAESGVGKSSLLRAGVAAHLRQRATDNIQAGNLPSVVPVVFDRWTDDPVADLTIAIAKQTASFIYDVRTARLLEHSDDGEREQARPRSAESSQLAAAINEAAAGIGGRLAVILDQFDELFGNQTRPGRLADELAACINSPDVKANFLIAVREDAYGKIGDFFRRRLADPYGNYLQLEYLTPEQAREAIEEPVARYSQVYGGHEIIVKDELTDAVLKSVGRGTLELGTGRQELRGGDSVDSSDDQIEAPFLQLVMERLWDWEIGHGSDELRESTLTDELGGAEEIVRQHFDRALADLSEDEVEIAGEMFKYLVTSSGRKLAQTAAELAGATGHSQSELKAVLIKLDEQRIVRGVDPAPRNRERRYELFHDRLAVPILEWRNQREKHRLEREKLQAARRAQAFMVLALACVVALGGAVYLWQYALRQKQAAAREGTTADAIGLSYYSQLNVARRPDVALSLGLAAYRLLPSYGSSGAMIASLEAFRRTGELAILHGHTDTVNAVAFSPSGDVLASGSSDATIRLWDARTHRQIGGPLKDPAATGIVGVAFSPDGRILASAGGFDPTIRLWDVSTRQEIGQIPADRKSGYAYAVAFSPRGSIIATSGEYQSIALWDARTLKRLGPPLPCACGKVASVAFSPDGRLLASGGYDRTVRLWDVATHRLIARLTGPSGTIYSLAFSPDGQTIVTSGTDSVIRLWSVARRAEIEPPLAGHAGPVTDVAFSVKGRYLASSSADSTVRLWSVRRHREVGLLTGHAGTVLGVAFSSNGDTLASAGTDGTVRLWDPQTQRRLGEALSGQSGTARSIAVSSDGNTIASASSDGKVRLWDTRTLLELGNPMSAHDGAVHSVAFSPHGSTLAVGAADGGVTIWNADIGHLRARLGLAKAAVNSVAFSPDGRELAAGDQRGMISLWNLRSDHIIRRLRAGEEAVNSVAFSPDGKLLATADEDSLIRLWDAHTLRPLAVLSGSKGPVQALAFSRDSRVLASGGDDKLIRLWNTLGHASIRSLSGSAGSILTLAFSPDGDVLASGGSDYLVRLWNVRAGTALGPPLNAHANAVYGVAFTPDGRTLFSGSSDGTVRVWDGIFWRSLPDLEDQVCSLIGNGLSKAEWSDYASGISYRSSC